MFWGRRRGQEVGRAERAERELATGAPDLLSAGHSPHPFGLVTGPSFQLCFGQRPTVFCGSPLLRVLFHRETVCLPQYSFVGTVVAQSHSLFME